MVSHFLAVLRKTRVAYGRKSKNLMVELGMTYPDTDIDTDAASVVTGFVLSSLASGTAFCKVVCEAFPCPAGGLCHYTAAF